MAKKIKGMKVAMRATMKRGRSAMEVVRITKKKVSLPPMKKAMRKSSTKKKSSSSSGDVPAAHQLPADGITGAQVFSALHMRQMSRCFGALIRTNGFLAGFSSSILDQVKEDFAHGASDPPGPFPGANLPATASSSGVMPPP